MNGMLSILRTDLITLRGKCLGLRDIGCPSQPFYGTCDRHLDRVSLKKGDRRKLKQFGPNPFSRPRLRGSGEGPHRRHLRTRWRIRELL